MYASRAILEAMKGEDKIHIIDFQFVVGTQWNELFNALARKPGAPPNLRITAIDYLNSYSGLQIAEAKERLSSIAECLKVPFEFHACDRDFDDDDDVEPQKKLGVREGEALAVNFAFVLHRVPENHRDMLLRLGKRLSPKVVTLVEQECNTNTTEFIPRFHDNLDYYTAMFESLDVMPLPRDNKDRISVEKYWLARDIVNMVACEGEERVERHELLHKWRSRFAMAGFTPFPLRLSLMVNNNYNIKKLLGIKDDWHRYKERDGALYLSWKDRDLAASSA